MAYGMPTLITNLKNCCRKNTLNKWSILAVVRSFLTEGCFPVIRFFTRTCTHVKVLKAQYHLLSDVILRLRNNVIIMYFDRYLSCFGIKIQLILANLYKLKIEY